MDIAAGSPRCSSPAAWRCYVCEFSRRKGRRHITDGSGQTGYSLAFTFNLVPASTSRTRPRNNLRIPLRLWQSFRHGLHRHAAPAARLARAGHDDLAYTLLLQQTYPSWLFQVTLGATTMWERWDGWTPGGGFQTIGMNSFNHYAFGSVGEYLYSAVVVSIPASPGYKSILIQPVPGAGLTGQTELPFQAGHDFHRVDQYRKPVQSQR